MHIRPIINIHLFFSIKTAIQRQNNKISAYTVVCMKRDICPMNYIMVRVKTLLTLLIYFNNHYM